MGSSGHSSSLCPSPEDACHLQPHQESATDQHVVLVNMPPVKLLFYHFRSVSVAFSTFTAWLSPPSGPELLHPQEKLCLSSSYPHHPQPCSNHGSFCPCEFGQLTHKWAHDLYPSVVVSIPEDGLCEAFCVCRLYQMFIFKEHYTMVLVIHLPLDGHLGPSSLLALAHSATLSLGIEVAF